MQLVGACLALLVGAAPGPAPLVPTPLLGQRVVVIAHDDEHSLAADVVEAALRARGLRILDDNERGGLGGRGRRVVAGDRQQARARLLQAHAAWRQLDLPAADEAITLALDEAVRLDRPEEHVDLLVDALVFQVTVRLARGAAADDVMDGMRLAARLEPDRQTLDQALHPPSVAQLWTDARASNAAAPLAVTFIRPRVLGSDASVEVRIDGTIDGAGDGLLRLTTGPHLLSLRAPGCRTTSRIISVGADMPAADDVLQSDSDFDARTALVLRLRDGDSTALPPLLMQVGVDVAVVINTDATQALVMRRGEAVKDVALTVAEANSPDAPMLLTDAIFKALTPPAPPGAPSLPPPTPLDDDMAWATVGTAAGVALAGVAIGVAVWTFLPGTEPTPPPRPIVVIGIGL